MIREFKVIKDTNKFNNVFYKVTKYTIHKIQLYIYIY